MAQPLINVQTIVNGIDLSDHAHTFQVSDTAAVLDVTAFGGNGYVQEQPGLKTATITVDYYTDFAAAKVHATLQPLYQSGTAFPFTFLADSTQAVSATNPRGSMLARLYQYEGINGAVGAVSSTQAVFHNAGSGIVWGTV